MNADQVRISTGDVESTYEIVGPIEAASGAFFVFSKSLTIDGVNSKLRVVAHNLGADAVIHVECSRGMKLWSWKALTAKGTAVVTQPNSRG